jgi:hypothetical protein
MNSSASVVVRPPTYQEGTSLVSASRAIQAQGRDYYRRMREGIITMHRGGSDPTELWKIVEAAPVRMRENFTACAKGYEKWMRGKGLIWSRRPRSREWKYGPLSVTANPELLINV